MDVGVVGLGLIGGSLGFDLRALGHRVLGVSRNPETCHRAIALGIADETSPNLNILRDAQVIFLCTPLGVMEATFHQLLPYLRPDTIVTDVGSVKGPIVRAIAPLWLNFVGGHPMAGTSESGIEAAQKNLFTGAAYVLTPVDTTPVAAVETVRALAIALQTRVYQCHPDHHDQAVAWISHLPVMVSASLIEACMQERDGSIRAIAQALASSGFRDTSRVGGGNPELGVMMAQYNRDALLRTLHTYQQELTALINTVESQDWPKLTAKLLETQQHRPQFGQQFSPQSGQH